MKEAIIFDFDGVLAKSNDIREKTYFDIFNHIKNSGELVKEALTEDQKRNRYGILQAALQKLKDKNLMQFQDIGEETEKYVNKYNEITEQEVSVVEEVPGANNALKVLSKKYDLFIVTGTMQKSIDVVLKNRKLEHYFKKVYGGFRDKIGGMKLLLLEQGIEPKKSIFVGDGKSDYECAKKFGIMFIGVLNDTNNFGEMDDVKYALYDLKRLPGIVEKIKKDF